MLSWDSGANSKCSECNTKEKICNWKEKLSINKPILKKNEAEEIVERVKKAYLSEIEKMYIIKTYRKIKILDKIEEITLRELRRTYKIEENI